MKTTFSPPFLKRALRFLPGRSVLLGAVLLGTSHPSLHAQFSLSANASVNANNETSNGVNGYTLVSESSSDGSYVSAQAAPSFTGLDRNGNTQTMTFNGFGNGSATYGGLHIQAGGTVTNTYYNATNPAYVNDDGSVNPAGSPNYFNTNAYCTFNDTLQYGGTLQAGYQARYIFQVDGASSGYGVLTNLEVSIAGNNEQTFSDNGLPGSFNATYATMDYPINGQTPQTVNVTLSGQFNLETSHVADGSTITGESNYSDTATLTGIEIVDANGNPVSGATVTSGSGTVYQEVVPEPSTWAALLAGCAVLLVIQRRRSRA